MTSMSSSSETPQPESATPAVDAIRAGYAFDEPAIEVGVALTPTDPVPDAPVRLPLGMMNRHGLIAGATGTGKTVTLQVLAEQLSRAGVPVFASDIKGDLTGMSAAAQANPKLTERTDAIGQDWTGRGCPVQFTSLGGIGTGVPLRATVSDFGPLLLSKVLGLNETQESVLSLIFHFADKEGRALLDLSDLRAVLNHLDSPEGKEDFRSLGGASAATLGVILRQVAQLEAAGGEDFFGEPAFDTADLLRTTEDGQGIITMLELAGLQDRPVPVLHVPHVAARGPVPGPAGGGRSGQAVARLLLRRGAPPLRGRLEGLPGRGHPHRPPHPVEGRGRLLRDADAQGRARGRAGPAGLPRPAPAARPHPQRPEGAAGDRPDVPHQRVRPRGAPHHPAHGRGRRDRHGPRRRSHAGRRDSHARTGVADRSGPGRGRRGRRRRLPALRDLRRAHRP